MTHTTETNGTKTVTEIKTETITINLAEIITGLTVISLLISALV